MINLPKVSLVQLGKSDELVMAIVESVSDLGVYECLCVGRHIGE
jgi:hypothetical protein